MKKRVLVINILAGCLTFLCFAPFGIQATGQDSFNPAGSWEGKLVIPQGTLTIVFNVARSEDGTYTATMDSPDQGATGIPVSKVTIDGKSVRFDVAAVAGNFVGTAHDNDRISGSWSQGPASLPLDLSRANDEDSNDEESEDTETSEVLPYLEEQITFSNSQENITLAGTLTLPEGKGPFPAVVLVSGSGPQDRDETIFGHKPFKVLADHLTRDGIAVLRYDDRGVGESGGNFAEGTTTAFARDAYSAHQFLIDRSDIDGGHVGIIGHSEGGIIAPLVANMKDDVAFIILLAGPALPGRDILLAQARLILLSSGLSPSVVQTNTEIQEKLFAVIDTGKTGAELETALRDVFTEVLGRVGETEKNMLGLSDVMIDAQIKATTSPWFVEFLQYDPRPTLTEVTVPVLALFGEKDLQVPPQTNHDAMKSVFESSGNSDYEIIILENLNHLFQTADSGLPAEYGRIEETVSPKALQVISDWILERI